MPNNNRGDKERLILEAAVRVFAETGYHGSSIADIATAAGVATGTIYLYFKRKEDLLVSMFQRYLGGYLARSSPLLQAEPAGGARLRKLIELHLHFFETDRALASVFQIHLREPNETIRDGIRPTLLEYFDQIEGVIVSGAAAGEFADDLDPKLARRVLFGGLDEVVTSWLVSKRDYPLMSVLDPLYRMLAGALGVASAIPAVEETEA